MPEEQTDKVVINDDELVIMIFVMQMKSGEYDRPRGGSLYW
jgi:hypothetical protein